MIIKKLCPLLGVKRPEARRDSTFSASSETKALLRRLNSFHHVLPNLQGRARSLHTAFLIRHGLSFICVLAQCRAHHLIRTVIHPRCQGRLNRTGLWTPLHLTRLVAKSKWEEARRAPACCLLRVVSCLMRGCLQHCVTRNTAHLICPIASLRVWRCTPISVVPLRTLLALIRQLAWTRSMYDGFSHSGRM